MSSSEMIDSGSDNGEWVTVKKKDKKNNIHIQPVIKKLQKDYVISVLQDVLVKYNPKGIFLHGSTARGTNRDTSDVDLVVVWKKNIPSNIEDIKNKLEYIFQRHIDFVNMIYKGKILVERDMNAPNISKNDVFLNNVIEDAIAIVGNNDDIMCSLYVSKM